MRKYLVAAIMAALSSGSLSVAKAATVDINFIETASGVNVAGSGAFDTIGLTLEFANQSPNGLRFLNPSEGGFGFGSGNLVDFFAISGSQSFGAGNVTALGQGVGNYFGIAFGGPTSFVVGLDSNYISSAPLLFSSSIAGASFDSLGITASPVTISAGLNDINLSFETQVVPLPASAWMMLTGLFALGAVGRRRKRAALAG